MQDYRNEPANGRKASDGHRVIQRSIRLLVSDESGQVLPWVIVMLVGFLSMSALVVDVGHAMVVQRQLQSSADAAALAAAQTLPNTTYNTVGQTYTAASGKMNAYSDLTVSAPTITGKCLATVASWGAPCSASVPNAVSVTQTAHVNTFFARMFGVNSVAVSATSTAAAKGANPLPYNVAIILDSTLSMSTIDPNCGNQTQMACALAGLQELLKVLYPTVDHVSLFTFPNVTSGTASIDYSCTTPISGGNYYYYNSVNAYISMLPDGSWGQYGYNGTPWSTMANAMPYSFPPINATSYTPPTGTFGPTYQVVPFSTDYRVSSTSSTLNTSSDLVKAAGGVSGCGGLAPSNYDGDYGTYYAGAMYAAQAALDTEQASNPGSNNVIVILGDGNSTAPNASNSPDSNSAAMPATSSQAERTYDPATKKMISGAFTLPSSYSLATNKGTYPSWIGECGQTVDAATYIANKGTKVFSIAYGASTTSDSGDCASDQQGGTHRNISPCTTMKDIASNTSYFYSDYYAPGGDSGCQAPDQNNTITSLSDIFKTIATTLTSVRLIPNNTQ